jgi:PTH1 family peptidyl-tRNA hydrolase
MKLIVGLGNPGKKYEGTRHNIGRLVVEQLAREMTNGQWLMVKKLKSLVINHQLLFVLAKPVVFMNESGRAVKRLLKHFKIEPANLWAIHDDIDLPLGRIKIQVGGGAAGHHGVESIIKEIGSEDFVRFRLGIGRPGKFSIFNFQFLNIQVEKFVLSKFNKEEARVVEKMVERTAEAIRFELKEGIEKAMARKF